MLHFPDGDIFAGLSGLQLDFEELELGQGVNLRRTYAHLMAPFLMAFEPAPPGGHHPAPWKTAHSSMGFDVTAELLIPESFNADSIERLRVAKTIIALMRLWASPSITLPVVSNISFSNAAQAPDGKASFIPLEVAPRRFPLKSSDGSLLTVVHLQWIKDYWLQAIKLIDNHAELQLAIDAIDNVQFIPNKSLALVSLWGAIEALFSPARTELRFRVSALLASYLQKPGEHRLKLHKKVMLLYNERSTAVHGLPSKNPDILLQTFELLRSVLLKMIGDNHVPSKDELEECLFYSES